MRDIERKRILPLPKFIRPTGRVLAKQKGSRSRLLEPTETVRGWKKIWIPVSSHHGLNLWVQLRVQSDSLRGLQLTPTGINRRAEIAVSGVAKPPKFDEFQDQVATGDYIWISSPGRDKDNTAKQWLRWSLVKLDPIEA